MEADINNAKSGAVTLEEVIDNVVELDSVRKEPRKATKQEIKVARDRANTMVKQADMDAAVGHLARWVEQQIKFIVEKVNTLQEITDTLAVITTAQTNVLSANDVCTKEDVTKEIDAVIAKLAAEAEEAKAQAEAEAKKDIIPYSDNTVRFDGHS